MARNLRIENIHFCYIFICRKQYVPSTYTTERRAWIRKLTRKLEENY